MSLIAINFVLALFYTIIIELLVAFLFGFRKKTEIIAIILVNLVTNPILNYLLLVIGYSSLFGISQIFIVFLELIVVLVEWKLLVFVLQDKPKRLLLLSIAMNLCSYMAGFLIFR